MPTAELVASVVDVGDGRSVTVRDLSADDAEALVDAVEHGDPQDLRRRFMGPPPPATFLVSRLRAVDGVHHVAVGAFDADGTLIGNAQFDRPDDRPVAEIAIQVERRWQHHGLGSLLLSRLADRASAVGVTTFTATFLADNFAIRRLLRETGRVVSTTCADGEGHAVLDLRRSA